MLGDKLPWKSIQLLYDFGVIQVVMKFPTQCTGIFYLLFIIFRTKWQGKSESVDFRSSEAISSSWRALPSYQNQPRYKEWMQLVLRKVVCRSRPYFRRGFQRITKKHFLLCSDFAVPAIYFPTKRKGRKGCLQGSHWLSKEIKRSSQVCNGSSLVRWASNLIE